MSAKRVAPPVHPLRKLHDEGDNLGAVQAREAAKAKAAAPAPDPGPSYYRDRRPRPVAETETDRMRRQAKG